MMADWILNRARVALEPVAVVPIADLLCEIQVGVHQGGDALGGTDGISEGYSWILVIEEKKRISDNLGEHS